MLHEASLVIAGVAILAYGLEFLFSHLDDPREPRRVASTIPVIGHIVGFLHRGFDYYGTTSQSTDAEIYTIGILNFKVYITHATRLTQIIQRSKTLSFRPFLQVSKKVVSDETHALFNGELLESFSTLTKETLTPGPHLDVQNLRMGDVLVSEIDELVKQNDFQMLEWAKHAIVQATSAGLYGVGHPFKDPEVENALWDWENRRPRLDAGFDPLGRGYKARTKVFEAFRDYFKNLPEDASLIIRERQRILAENGIREEDRYKMQATLSTAAFPNTVPTLFWTIYEIYSRPDLLDEIRKEVSSKAVRKSEGGGFTLELAVLQTECPLLLSAYQETQRTRHSQVAFRMVLEDTLLDGRYLLKKGNVVHIPAKPTHKDTSIWGAQAAAFDPYRFVPAAGRAGGGGEKEKAKVVPSSFLAWGRPPYLCPARQFASTEILMIVALLVLRIDLAPVGGKGWEEPAVRSGMEIPTIPRPKEDMRLRITVRDEMAGSWKVIIGEGKTRISLASG